MGEIEIHWSIDYSFFVSFFIWQKKKKIFFFVSLKLQKDKKKIKSCFYVSACS